MRCTTCNHPLWDTPAGPCPGCGEPFKPSDFTFTPESVRFHCPSCGQEYYGTDARGHLVPVSFTCVSCSGPVRMDEMILTPAEPTGSHHLSEQPGPAQPADKRPAMRSVPMRCTNCEYPLWNLPAGPCPECGTPFKPSDFEFVPNAVQFLCPHCKQDYYGTDEIGHLVPNTFDCIRCERRIEMDEMLLLPTQGVTEQQTGVRPFPWLDKQMGRSRRFWATIGVGMGSPITVERLPNEAHPGRAIAFALWLALLTTLLGGGLMFVLLAIPALSPSAGGGPSALYGVGMVAAWLAGSILVWLLSVVVVALIQHAFLKVTGSTRAGYGGTLETLCYCTGPVILVGVPCLGFYMLPITVLWTGITQIFAIKSRQGVGGGRAAIAGLMFPIVWYAGVGVLIAWFVYGITQAFPNQGGLGGMGSAVSDQSELRVLHLELTSYAGASNGAGPDHAVQLMTNGNVNSDHFISSNTFTTPTSVPVGPGTLGDFGPWGSQQQEATNTSAAITALPADTIAHRLGDFVFTYHGVGLDRSAQAPLVVAPISNDLWMIVACPDPDINTPIWGGWPGDYTVWAVIETDGDISLIDEFDFPQELAGQNQLRMQAGLVPLPDPRTVTHAKPVTESVMNGLGYQP